MAGNIFDHRLLVAVLGPCAGLQVNTLAVEDLRNDNRGRPGFVRAILEATTHGRIYDDSDGDGDRVLYAPLQVIRVDGKKVASAAPGNGGLDLARTLAGVADEDGGEPGTTFAVWVHVACEPEEDDEYEAWLPHRVCRVDTPQQAAAEVAKLLASGGWSAEAAMEAMEEMLRDYGAAEEDPGDAGQESE